MAPMVGAVFSYFHWSSCSAREYHMKARLQRLPLIVPSKNFNFNKQSSTWTCMSNYPESAKNATFIGNVVEYSYSLDDQCRMEFGEGFGFCKSFQANA